MVNADLLETVLPQDELISGKSAIQWPVATEFSRKVKEGFLRIDEISSVREKETIENLFEYAKGSLELRCNPMRRKESLFDTLHDS